MLSERQRSLLAYTEYASFNFLSDLCIFLYVYTPFHLKGRLLSLASLNPFLLAKVERLLLTNPQGLFLSLSTTIALT